MMDFMTTKQWAFVAAVAFVASAYFLYKIWMALKVVEEDRTVTAALIIRLGTAMGFDITREK